MIIGLWVRLKLTETPAFEAVLGARNARPRSRWANCSATTGSETLGGTFGVVACFCIYYIATAFALGYGTTTLGIPRETFLQMQLVAILFLAGGIVVAGYWADARTRASCCSAAARAASPAGFLLAPMMGGGILLLIGVVPVAALFLMGFVYGPLGAWLPGLSPRACAIPAPASRSMSAASSAAASRRSRRSGWPTRRRRRVGPYLAAAVLLSLIGLLILPEKNHPRGLEPSQRPMPGIRART